MPTEFRFDDLDLREQPPSGKFEEADSTLHSCAYTCTCTTSYDTCTTYLC